MMIAHPIPDMLTRIRNAVRKLHPEVSMPHSKMKEAVARVLAEQGYIEGYDVDAAEPQPVLRLKLRYQGERSRRKSAISEVHLVSKPSRRVYSKKGELPRPLGGMGISIVSTSEGIMVGEEARSRGIGGEVLCEVW